MLAYVCQTDTKACLWTVGTEYMSMRECYCRGALLSTVTHGSSRIVASRRVSAHQSNSEQRLSDQIPVFFTDQAFTSACLLQRSLSHFLSVLIRKTHTIFEFLSSQRKLNPTANRGLSLTVKRSYFPRTMAASRYPYVGVNRRRGCALRWEPVPYHRSDSLCVGGGVQTPPRAWNLPVFLTGDCPSLNKAWSIGAS